MALVVAISECDSCLLEFMPLCNATPRWIGLPPVTIRRLGWSMTSEATHKRLWLPPCSLGMHALGGREGGWYPAITLQRWILVGLWRDPSWEELRSPANSSQLWPGSHMSEPLETGSSSPSQAFDDCNPGWHNRVQPHEPLSQNYPAKLLPNSWTTETVK